MCVVAPGDIRRAQCGNCKRYYDNSVRRAASRVGGTSKDDGTDASSRRPFTSLERDSQIARAKALAKALKAASCKLRRELAKVCRQLTANT